MTTIEEERTEVRKRAAGIAAALGGWKLLPVRDAADWFAEIRSPDNNLTLYINNTWKKDRLVINGQYYDETNTKRLSPKDTYALKYDETLPEITVANDRPAEAIAKDIQRRLLPAYAALLGATRQRATDQADVRAQEVAAITEVAEVVGEDVRGDKENQNARLSVSISRGDVYGDIETYSANGFKVEFRNVPKATVIAIATLIGTLPVKED